MWAKVHGPTTYVPTEKEGNKKVKNNINMVKKKVHGPKYLVGKKNTSGFQQKFKCNINFEHVLIFASDRKFCAHAGIADN